MGKGERIERRESLYTADGPGSYSFPQHVLVEMRTDSLI
jgi:hypothetical protein